MLRKKITAEDTEKINRRDTCLPARQAQSSKLILTQRFGVYPDNGGT